VFDGLAALEVLEAVPLPPLADAVPPPRYVRDWCVEVLEVMVPLLLPVLDAGLMVPDSSVVEETSEDNVTVVDRDRYVTLPVGKSPIALPPFVTVPLNVSTLCAETAAADSRAVQIGGAIEIVESEKIMNYEQKDQATNTRWKRSWCSRNRVVLDTDGGFTRERGVSEESRRGQRE
jgi:hypothetical protein